MRKKNPKMFYLFLFFIIFYLLNCVHSLLAKLYLENKKSINFPGDSETVLHNKTWRITF